MIYRSAHLKVEQGKFLLTSAQKAYNFTAEKMHKNSEDLASIIKFYHCYISFEHTIELAAETSKIDEIKKVLREFIKFMGLLREEWGKLVLSFQMIKEILSITFKAKVLPHFSSTFVFIFHSGQVLQPGGRGRR